MDNFADWVMEQAAPPRGPFQPIAYYNQDGDCLELFLNSEPFHGKRLDSLLTVYYGEESGEICGFLIKGVWKLARKVGTQMPGLRREFESGKVRVELILTAHMWADHEIADDQLQVYDQLRDAARRSDAVAELSCTPA